MDSIFGFLFLISLGCLIAGSVKPDLFKKFFREKTSRSYVVKFFGVTALVIPFIATMHSLRDLFSMIGFALIICTIVGYMRPKTFVGIFKERTSKKFVSGVFGAITLFFLFLLGSTTDIARQQVPPKNVVTQSEGKAPQNIVAAQPVENTKTAADIEKDKTEEYNANLTKKIEEIKTFKNQDKSTMTSLTAELVVIGSWVEMIKEAKSKNEETSRSLGASLEKAASQTQIREFPLMRQAYAKMMKEKMWESNMEVSISGSASKTLELTWSAFAANKNIKSTQDTLDSMLKALRFTKVDYRWYKYDDGTEFTLATPKDSEVVSISF